MVRQKKASCRINFLCLFKNFLLKNIGVATTRAGNVIGGADWSENRVVPDIVRSIKSNKKLFIRQFSSTRPWQHVLEPIHGYLLLGYKLFQNPNKYSQSWNFWTKRFSSQNSKKISS